MVRLVSPHEQRHRRRLCGGCRCCLRLAPVGVGLAHCLQLLQLVGRQHRAELLLRVLADGAHLLAGVLRLEGGIGAQGCDLLIAIRKDRFEFSGLIGSEAQLPRDMYGLTMRVRGSCCVSGRLLWVCCGRLRRLREGQRSGEKRCKYCS